MTQLGISDELAATIASAASSRHLGPEAFLASLISQVEQDKALAERTLTPDLQTRFIRDREQARSGNFVSEEAINRKFDDFFLELDQNLEPKLKQR